MGARQQYPRRRYKLTSSRKLGCLKILKARHLSNVGIRSDAIGMKETQENERLRDGVIPTLIRFVGGKLGHERRWT